jgi:hypothetical protein
MIRPLTTLLMCAAFITAPFFAAQARADDYVPDDTIVMDFSAEGFVVTQTANVSVMVDAAADDAKAATLRTDMQKAVNDVAKAEWRLTSFNRSQDQTGLNRWQAVYEARIAEANLAGINDRLKKASRPGMQLTVANTDFTPTLAETEAKKSELRAELLKRANDELVRINANGGGRTYRLANINFGGGFAPFARPMPMMKMAGMRAEAMMADTAAMAAPQSAEVAQRLTMMATVVYGTRPVK